MTHDTVQLHRQAAECFRQVENGRKLVLIHTAGTLGIPFLVMLINSLLELVISDTGGLSGMGLRTGLTTAQTFLELAAMVALPFWEMGLLFTALQWAKGNRADGTSLLQGFRRFRSVLIYEILHTGIFLIVGFSVYNFAALVFAMTPFSAGLMEQLAQLGDPSVTAEQIEALLTSDEMMAVAAETTPVLLVIFLVVFVPIAAILFYRLRFGAFFVLEGERPGRALLDSLYITRKKGGYLVKLDLHFWWYYLLQLLCVAVGLTDGIAALLGISLPVSDGVAYYVTYAVSILLQGILFWRMRGQVLCTYCMAYNELVNPGITEVV